MQIMCSYVLSQFVVFPVFKLLFFIMLIVPWASDIQSWTAFRILIATSPLVYFGNTNVTLNLTESNSRSRAVF